MIEHVRPRPDRVAVLSAEHARLLSEPRNIGDGWVMGILTTECPWHAPLRFYRSSLGPWSGQATTLEITQEVIEFEQVGGGAWGVCDKRAPREVVLAAFDRLWHERVRKVLPVFLGQFA
jgi:hypothetical protein